MARTREQGTKSDEESSNNVRRGTKSVRTARTRYEKARTARIPHEEARIPLEKARNPYEEARNPSFEPCLSCSPQANPLRIAKMQQANAHGMWVGHVLTLREVSCKRRLAAKTNPYLHASRGGRRARHAGCTRGTPVHVRRCTRSPSDRHVAALFLYVKHTFCHTRGGRCGGGRLL